MRRKGTSEYHQNNNLKVIITIGKFIGFSFYGVNKREQIVKFLNKTVKR
jgi:hypothetical protein